MRNRAKPGAEVTCNDQLSDPGVTTIIPTTFDEHAIFSLEHLEDVGVIISGATNRFCNNDVCVRVDGSDLVCVSNAGCGINPICGTNPTCNLNPKCGLNNPCGLIGCVEIENA